MTLPSDDTLKWLVSRYAAVLAAAGDAFEGAELVTPTGEHFPDRFERDAPSVARLVKRMMGYTPLDEDLPIELAFFEPEDAPAQGEGGGGGCGSCGPTSCKTSEKSKATSSVQATRSGYRLLLSVDEAGHPVVLTSSLARCLGAMILAEAEVDGIEEIAAEAEVAAAASGLGVLLSAAAHIYGKSCGGVSVRRTTALSLEETTFVLALFCAVHEIKPSRARAHMELSQREAFAESVDLVAKNTRIVRALREAPETLADGHFPIEHERGLLSRLFAKDEEPELLAPAKKAAPKSEDEKRRLAEAKALVEEALSEG